MQYFMKSKIQISTLLYLYYNQFIPWQNIFAKFVIKKIIIREITTSNNNSKSCIYKLG